MLAARSLRLAAVRYVRPAQVVKSSKVTALPMLKPDSLTWMVPFLAAGYSKDAKTAESPLKSIDPPLTSVPLSDNISAPSSSSTSETKSSYPSTSQNIEEIKSHAKEYSTGSFGEAGIKLPSKDQVESFAFKSLVYFWDFTYYLFCLCRTLFEKYVWSNYTVQQNLKQLQKRMEDARKELKPK